MSTSTTRNDGMLTASEPNSGYEQIIHRQYGLHGKGGDRGYDAIGAWIAADLGLGHLPSALTNSPNRLTPTKIDSQ